MTARSEEDHQPGIQVGWVLGAVVCFGVVGAVVDQLWGEPGNKVEIERIPELIGTGFGMLVMVVCVVTVVVGFTMTVLTALWSAGQAFVRATGSVQKQRAQATAAVGTPVATQQVPAPDTQRTATAT